MLQSKARTAALVVLSTTLATTAASAQAHRGGPGPAAAPRAAPAPHFSAPAPHISAPAPHFSAPAPRMATPHISAPPPRISAPAPHISAPRVMPAPHVAPQHVARPSGGSSPNVAPRHVEVPRIVSAPPHERARVGGGQTEGKGGGNVAPNAGLAHQGTAAPGGRNATPQNRLGGGQTEGKGGGNVAPNLGLAHQGTAAAGGSRNATPQNRVGPPNQTFQLAGGHRVPADRVLRNQFFAAKATANDPAARMLARATFHGRFFDSFAKRRHFPRLIAIGWVGPLFWPYAYNDFVDYTFYPYAYDTFWPTAYDDVYDGIFGGYAYGTGSAYAYRTGPAYADVGRPGSRRGDGQIAATADLCTGQTTGLTDWPIEQIARAVEPNDAQRTALDQFKDATAKALDVLKAACPTELPSTPVGRLAAMHQRLEAMLQAVRIVRPALENFYGLLNDEQKARFNALGSDEVADQQNQSDLAQVCGERTAGIASLPIAQIERTVRPDEPQRSALKELEDATAQAVELLKTDCPTYRALTPVVRLEAMEQRLDAMLRAVQTVEPALQRFYGSLSDEQKERFNRLPPRQA
jgi:LTXXQ motif family protein